MHAEMEGTMSVNGINTSAGVNAYQAYATTTKKATAEKTTSTDTSVESGVVYEPSKKEETTVKKETKTYKQNTELINKLKADAEARTAQLRSLVEKMMLGQGNAYGQANDIWKFLASGEYTVDPATKAQAQADIAEDGYWGVNQTSDRIINFATALTGGDPSKIEEMRDAFIKGFEMAKKAWGGELPEISQQTYDAVMEKFDKLAAEAAGETTTIVE